MGLPLALRIRCALLVLCTAIVSAGLVGCGQKGPLFLPEPEAPQSQDEQE